MYWLRLLEGSTVDSEERLPPLLRLLRTYLDEDGSLSGINIEPRTQILLARTAHDF